MYETAVKEAKEAISKLAGIKGSLEDYIDALEDIQSDIEISIDAAREDIKRRDGED